MHKTFRGRAGAVAAALVAGASLYAGVGVAQAHSNSISSEIHIASSGPGGVTGHVMSNKGKCLRRTVKLWKMSGGEPNLFFTRKSGTEGYFAFNDDLPSGRYFVTATKKHLLMEDGHHHVCARAESNKFLIG